jgi:hypothetical protein
MSPVAEEQRLLLIQGACCVRLGQSKGIFLSYDEVEFAFMQLIQIIYSPFEGSQVFSSAQLHRPRTNAKSRESNSKPVQKKQYVHQRSGIPFELFF